MESESVFDVLSIDRNKVKWEDYISVLTPIERIGDMNFKREDLFAPLGVGGINGSKLRQAIYLVMKNKKGKKVLVSGASVKSPQLPMGSAVALHYGLESHHVIGATKIDSCMKRDMVEMATWFKAEFTFLKVGYNPCLQSEVKKLIQEEEVLHLPYGIASYEDSSPKDIGKFHYVGANQVRNIPDEIETIIIPAGSCNSCVSVLYGLGLFKPKNLKNVILVGIGPSKIKYIEERLRIIKKFTNINTMNFVSEEVQSKYSDDDAYNLMYIDINSIPKYNYQNEVKFTYNGLEFHPTYEGKVMDFITTNLPELINPSTLFWVVGAKSNIKNMMDNCPELGAIPTLPTVKKSYL